MQTFLTEIKQLLTDWYLLTLENPLYAGALVLSAWLLTVLYYSIRIYILNKKQSVTEQASHKLQGQLDETLQQNQQSEEKLTTLTEQQAKEQQFATEFAHKVEMRNHQIVENIKQLANKFDLSEQLVATEEKPKAEFVWQQQDNIQQQLTERLQAEEQAKNRLEETYKLEKERFINQNALVVQLQQKNDLQINKSAQLEQDLNEQKLIHQQQKNAAEQNVAEVQAKHKLDIAALVNDLKESRESLTVDTKSQEVIDCEVKDEISSQGLSEEVSQPQSSINESDLMQKVDEIAPSIETEVVVNESIPEVLEFTVSEELVEQVAVKEQTPVFVPEVVVSEPEELEVEPDYTKSNLDITEKFKSLFSKDKKQVDKTKAEHQVEELTPELRVPESEESEVKADYSEPKLDITGKFKSLFGKDKKQADKTKPEQQVEELAAEPRVPELERLEVKAEYSEPKLDITGKFKNLLAKGKKQADALTTKVVEPESEVVGAVDGEPKLNITGKLKKNLFSRAKNQTDTIESQRQKTEELLTGAQESEEQVFEPDYTKSNFKIPAQVKKLFGKK